MDGSIEDFVVPNGEYKIEVNAKPYIDLNLYTNENYTDYVTIYISTTSKKLKNRDNIPIEFTLSNNHPNPFNPSTVIKYQLPQTNQVNLKIYNLFGQEIRTLVSENQQAGYYSSTWDGRDQNGQMVATGIYFYKIQAGEYNQFYIQDVERCS